jgi:hypothetical protein
MKWPPGPLDLDTNIYILLSHGQDYGWLRTDDIRFFYRSYLTAVVAAELYAGIRSQQ